MIALRGLGKTIPKTLPLYRISTLRRNFAGEKAAESTRMILPSGPNPGQSIGFSFSPGGLLLPYHMGVADCLIKEGYIDPSQTVLAGSSAGAIATMAIGCGLDPIQGLEGTISISDRCLLDGKPARGNLLPLLEEQMEALVGDEQFEFLRARRQQQRSQTRDKKTGTGIALAYREVFPRRMSHFQTTFEDREELFRSVGYSCMFPFFTTNFPCLLDTTPLTNPNQSNDGQLRIPRLLMDGYFSLPRPHFGCPVLQDEFPDSGVDRTVAITCIPQDIFGMDEVFGRASELGASLFPASGNNNSKEKNNLISINDSCDETDPLGMPDIFKLATQPTSRKELTDLFERGYRDAEGWCRREEDNRKQQQ
jgi:hypothetical protein